MNCPISNEEIETLQANFTTDMIISSEFHGADVFVELLNTVNSMLSNP